MYKTCKANNYWVLLHARIKKIHIPAKKKNKTIYTNNGDGSARRSTPLTNDCVTLLVNTHWEISQQLNLRQPEMHRGTVKNFTMISSEKNPNWVNESLEKEEIHCIEA